jgi:hypothetical protein
MKTKRFDKKLSLNKKTIARLNDGEMVDVNGGFVITIMPTCVVICTETCSCILSVCDTCS